MPEAITVDFAQPIPLFPLRNCALLPHATVPIHVFEERYRTMTKEALEGSSLIAMAVFEGDAWQDNYEGSPPVRDHVCVGYIIRHQQLPDGRYNILLQGICRAKILRELPHDEYRMAMLEPTETMPLMEIDMVEHRVRLQTILDDGTLKQLAAVSAMDDWLSDEVPTTAMVDLAILTLCQSVEDRYAMLAEPDPEARAVWLERFLEHTRKLLKTADRLGPAMTDDGIPLN